MPSQFCNRCAGCNKFIRESETEVFSATGQVIGYVHKAPPDTRSTLLLDCHKRAFRNLEKKHLVILIQGRRLNNDIVTEAERRRRKSGSSFSGVPHALSRVGDPSYIANTNRQSRHLAPI